MENGLKRAETVAVHHGEERPNGLRAITTPIACTTTFRFECTQDVLDVVEGRSVADDYARYSNPTVRTAERKIAALEGAEDCALFASGMAAVTTSLLALLSQGQHVVLGGDGYHPSEQFMRQTLARFGVTHTVVPSDDMDAYERAIIPGVTKAIFLENPTNPHLHVADLERLAQIRSAHRGVKLLVDATFATPLNQRPLAWGVDLVIQSATKFLGGHNDLMAGAVSGRAGLVSVVRDLRNQLGPTADPHAAYLLIRGIKSFPARMRQHNASALAVARFLESHPRVRVVYYPGLASHPHHDRAHAQLTGFGGVVAFEHDGDFEASRRFCDACRVFQIGASLGGAESLLHPPVLFSYWDLPPDERQARGLSDALIRLAVGLESTEDLIDDLRHALDAI